MDKQTFPRARRSSGFTLIEVMIAIAIIGILVAIALPAYKENVARGRRTDVQTVLLEDAQYMQRYYAANNAYTGSPAPSLPVSNSPRDALGTAVNYTVRVSASTATSFTLTATPTNVMANDKCGSFTYTDQQQKGLVNQAAGSSVSSCWR